MIRIVIVDDHPAVRAGLETVLRGEPGMVPVGSVSDVTDLWPTLYRTKPDMVLLDYHLPDTDGLAVCRQIKRQLMAPSVLIYTAYAGSALSIPATVAGADGLVGKGVPAAELYDVIRRVAKGERVIAPIERELLDDAGLRIELEDLPVMGMLLDETTEADMLDVLGIDAEELDRRVERILQRLSIEVPRFAP